MDDASLLLAVHSIRSSLTTVVYSIHRNATTVSTTNGLNSLLQCNKLVLHEILVYYYNLAVYVFPGVGLGVTVVGAKNVTDKMLYLAAEALANYVPPEDLAAGRIFPHINNIRHVSHRIAVAVAEEAIREGQATKAAGIENLPEYIANKMYYPQYVPLVEKREVTI